MSRASPAASVNYPLSANIAILGDTLLDVYRTVTRSEWDDALAGWAYDAHSEMRCPGGAANVATNVVALGGRARLVSIVGADAHGALVTALLTAGGVDVGSVESAPRYATPVLTRLRGLDGAGCVRIDQYGAAAQRPPGLRPQQWRPALQSCGAAVIADYGHLLDERTATAAVRLCRDAGTALIVDPGRGAPDWYRGASAFKVNAREASKMLGASDLERAACNVLARRLCERFDLQFAVVTDAADGAVAATRAGEILYAREATACTNATGGGDAVAAGLATALAAGLPLAAALTAAVRASARAVETECTCPRTPCVSRRSGVQTPGVLDATAKP